MFRAAMTGPFIESGSPGIIPWIRQGIAVPRCSENKTICHGVVHHAHNVRENPIKNHVIPFFGHTIGIPCSFHGMNQKNMTLFVSQQQR